MRGPELTIGALARAARVHVETIRHYRRIGLPPVPRSTQRSFRRHDRESLERVRFIRRAQVPGFSLDEI